MPVVNVTLKIQICNTHGTVDRKPFRWNCNVTPSLFVYRHLHGSDASSHSRSHSTRRSARRCAALLSSSSSSSSSSSLSLARTLFPDHSATETAVPRNAVRQPSIFVERHSPDSGHNSSDSHNYWAVCTMQYFVQRMIPMSGNDLC